MKFFWIKEPALIEQAPDGSARVVVYDYKHRPERPSFPKTRDVGAAPSAVIETIAEAA